MAGPATIGRMKTAGNKGREPWEQVLLMFETLHHDLRRVENTTAQLINRGGVTWDQIGEVVGLTDEGARKHYTKINDEPHRRRRRKKG